MRHTEIQVKEAIRASKELETARQIQNGPLKSYSYLIPLYQLEYRHHNDYVIFLNAPAGQDYYIQAQYTQYWYRSMTTPEFDQLNRNNRFYGDSYGGIAPYREYAGQYLTNTSPSTHIVEFKTPSAGFLYTEFTSKSWGVKAEGGGTYGLGPTGSGGGAAGAAFNKLLALRKISWELVDLRIVNTLS